MTSVSETKTGNPGTISTRTPITKWTGGPGCGKTHTLLEYVRYERDEHGTDIKDIQFMSYAKSQAADVRKRIAELFPDSTEKDRERHVKTIHGAALASLIRSGNLTMAKGPEDRGDRVIWETPRSVGPYVEFCRTNDLQYNPKIGSINMDDWDDFQYYGSLPSGNAFFSVNNFISAKLWPYTSWATAIHEMGLKVDKRDINTVIFTKWEGYKRSRRLWEHEDYCKKALEVRPHLPGKVLIIDEFQDVSPSHNALYEMWRDQGTFDQIYLAGDDNQAIYGFRGANLEFIRNTPATCAGAWAGDVPVSHRCPSTVVRLADLVIRGRSNMKPRSDGGTVKWVREQSAPAVIDHILGLYEQYGTVMVLSRFRSHVQQWHELLDKGGIPHLSLSKKFFSWDKVKSERDGKDQNARPMADFLGFLYAMAKYQDGKGPWTVPKKYTLGLNAVLSVPEEKKKRTDSFLYHLKPDQPVSIPDLLTRWGFPEDTTPHQLIGHMRFTERTNPTIRKRLAAALSNGRYIMPGSIQVDTVHAAKGLESPAVVVYAGFLEERLQDAQANPEEERRVGYVAVTRSSNHVSVVEPLTGPWNPVFQPVRGFWK